MDTVAFQLFLVVLALSGVLYLYFVPFGVAYGRGHKNTKTVFFLNLLFGWTGLGWISLLVWSFKGKKREDEEDRETMDQVKERLTKITQH